MEIEIWELNAISYPNKSKLWVRNKRITKRSLEIVS